MMFAACPCCHEATVEVWMIPLDRWGHITEQPCIVVHCGCALTADQEDEAIASYPDLCEAAAVQYAPN